jgi:lipopolysaccharide biosynthesis regulator YciM
MELDLWWLLIIPVAFGLGWAASRFDLRKLVSENARLPRSYFRGLNFLLNEQPDKAIDAFIEVVKLDPETTELHFALGSLFRRRGETERAIRVHQNLLNRADLLAAERDHALYELGQDFLKAGLLDRAEQTLASIGKGNYETDALRSLLAIFQIEKDWRKAITAAEELESRGTQSYRREIAQFHCELAEEALQRQHPDDARRSLQTALSVNPANARAAILLGDVDAAAGEQDNAIEHWRRVEKQNPGYLPLVVERIVKAYGALGRDADVVPLLVRYLDEFPAADLVDIAYDQVGRLQGAEAAHALAREQMRKAPGAAAMMRLIEAQAVMAEEPRRSELDMMRALVRQRTKNLPRFVCQNCGFRARLFYWQCPGCSGWETFAVRRIEPMASGG